MKLRRTFIGAPLAALALVFVAAGSPSCPAQEWVARHAGAGLVDSFAMAIVADADGNVYVTGTADGDYVTIKYSPDGQRLWEGRYAGTGGEDIPSAIAVDAAGNVYVTGSSEGRGGVSGPLDLPNLDWATVKYNSAGRLLWAVRHDGPAKSFDFASAIQVDADGNVYVAGTEVVKLDAATLEFDIDFRTIKYNSSGQRVWSSNYDGPANGFDFATGMVLDSQGAVYVTGISQARADELFLGATGFATVKYDQTGRQVWARRHDGGRGFLDGALAIAVDGRNNVYVTGTAGDQFTTIMYTSTGSRPWIRQHPGFLALPSDIVADAAGNVYVTGELDEEMVTFRYAPSGAHLWTARLAGRDGSEAFGSGVALDSEGNVYVTGATMGGPQGLDYATVKYDLNGEQTWIVRYNGPGNADDIGLALVVGPDGAVYVTGGSPGTRGVAEYATIKYGQGGTQASGLRAFSGGGSVSASSSPAVLCRVLELPVYCAERR